MADEDPTTAEPEEPTEEVEPEVTDEDDWTPPTREEWEKLQKESEELTDRGKGALDKERRQRRELEKQLRDLRKQNETDAERAAREAEETAQARLKPALIPIAAKAALLEANARPERAAALARLIDHTAVDVSGTDVTGLDAEVERLKEEFPEFFRAEDQEQGKPPAPPRVERGTRKPEPVTLSPMEQLAAQISGRK